MKKRCSFGKEYQNDGNVVPSERNSKMQKCRSLEKEHQKGGNVVPSERNSNMQKNAEMQKYVYEVIYTRKKEKVVYKV